MHSIFICLLYGLIFHSMGGNWQLIINKEKNAEENLIMSCQLGRTFILLFQSNWKTIHFSGLVAKAINLILVQFYNN